MIPWPRRRSVWRCSGWRVEPNWRWICLKTLKAERLGFERKTRRNLQRWTTWSYHDVSLFFLVCFTWEIGIRSSMVKWQWVKDWNMMKCFRCSAISVFGWLLIGSMWYPATGNLLSKAHSLDISIVPPKKKDRKVELITISVGFCIVTWFISISGVPFMAIGPSNFQGGYYSHLWPSYDRGPKAPLWRERQRCRGGKNNRIKEVS